MQCKIEFLIEPFEEGNPGRHVTSAVEALVEEGYEVTVGPFGNEVSGGVAQLIEALGSAMAVAMEEGATRITVNVTKV